MSTAPKLADQTRQLWGQLTGRRKLALMVAGVLPLLLLSVLMLGGSEPKYAVLYAGLSVEDAGDLVGELSRRGIDYKLEAGGTVVKVREDVVHEVRITTAAAGLPRGGGVGFEIFDGQSFGTSSFVEQVNYRRAVQGELSRSIASLAAVVGARVHIAMGKRSVFRESDEPPTASVAIRLHPGRKLNSDQVRGIVNLVAASVDGLMAEKVVVIDDKGNVLSSDEKAKSTAAANHDLESKLAGKVRRLLDRIVGEGRSAVTVTARMDYRQINQTEETYDQTKPAVRSETRTIEGAGKGATVGGVAGARGNLPGAPAPTTSTGAAGADRIHEVRNYELNHTIRRTVEPEARIAKLHVAVLVDYARDAEGAATPRTAEELANFATIAREAAGVDDTRGDRIEIRSVPFAEIATDDAPIEDPVVASAWPLPVSPTVAVAGGAGVLVLLIASFLMLRGRGKQTGNRPLVLPAPVHELEAVLAGATGPSDDTKGLPAPDLHSRVLAAVADNPSRAGRVVAAWLSEAGEKAA